MNRQDFTRLRLKVKTSTGINILCTAIKTQKVADWLPHFEQAYRQVKDDQEDDEKSKKLFIKALRIRKGNFYIANSEIIGDVFEDNDEVQCEIMVPESKKEKKERKREEKKNIQEKIEKVEIEEIEKPKKKVKKDIEIKKTSKGNTPSELKNKEQSRPIDAPNTKQVHSSTKKNDVLQKVDLGKLKSLIMKTCSKKAPLNFQPSPIGESDDNSSDQEES